ncbi:T9SS type A sorting domain-containing protein [Candidatus Eisenbacteria bacterium]|uniref:T9SS type A sorting domain-containing protein n=1 Tax=Eiseniibacteriota bacterium TaxID=2212470 RepID=A0ABV6YLE0_UNCEI
MITRKRAPVLIPLILTLFVLTEYCGAEISDLRASNHTSASVVVSWITSEETDGCVRFGLTTALGDTVCDLRGPDEVHYVEITGLVADTTYYYEVASNGEVDDNGGAFHTWSTTEIGIGVPYTIYGDLSLPPEWTVFLVTVKQVGGDSSLSLSTLADSTGVWFLNLGNLKDPASNDAFSYATGDSIFMTAQAGIHGVTNDTTAVSGSSPQYCGVMSSGTDPFWPQCSVAQDRFNIRTSPNPFSTQTSIRYRLPKAEQVFMGIYSTSGRTLETLVNRYQNHGSQMVQWNAEEYASGVYFLCLRVGKTTETHRITLLK